MDPFVNAGWEPLVGAAKAKAERVTGENRLDYAKRFGRKTVFMRDSGVLRLRAIGPRGEVLQLKLFSPDPQNLNVEAKDFALQAATGQIQKGVYVVPARTARLRGILTEEGLILKKADPRYALEVTDPTLSKQSLERAWPDVTYKGVLLLTGQGYPFQKLTDSRVIDRTLGDSGQEVFMGYSPKKDLFVVGYDFWPGEDEYEDDWRDRRARQKLAIMAGDMEWKAAVVKFDGNFSHIVKILSGHGGFYPLGRKEVKRAFPDIIELRLD